MTDSSRPHRKVVAATFGSGLGSALTIVALWVLSTFGVSVPPAVAAALAIIVTSVGAFSVGWITPAAQNDLPTPETAPPSSPATLSAVP